MADSSTPGEAFVAAAEDFDVAAGVCADANAAAALRAAARLTDRLGTAAAWPGRTDLVDWQLARMARLARDFARLSGVAAPTAEETAALASARAVVLGLPQLLHRHVCAARAGDFDGLDANARFLAATTPTNTPFADGLSDADIAQLAALSPPNSATSGREGLIPASWAAGTGSLTSAAESLGARMLTCTDLHEDAQTILGLIAKHVLAPSATRLCTPETPCPSPLDVELTLTRIADRVRGLPSLPRTGAPDSHPLAVAPDGESAKAEEGGAWGPARRVGQMVLVLVTLVTLWVVKPDFAPPAPVVEFSQAQEDAAQSQLARLYVQELSVAGPHAPPSSAAALFPLMSAKAASAFADIVTAQSREAMHTDTDVLAENIEVHKVVGGDHPILDVAWTMTARRKDGEQRSWPMAATLILTKAPERAAAGWMVEAATVQRR